MQRFDPNAQPVHGHGTATGVMKTFQGQKSLVGANPAVPSSPNVRMLGRYTVPVGHHGVTEPIELNSGSHKGFHNEVLTDEELLRGDTRFQRWHIDSALYKTHPPRVTSLWAHTLPKGPELTARWDDGSGTTLKVQPGLTAFLDASQMYDRLSDADKQWVDHSSAEYAPSPCQSNLCSDPALIGC